MFGINRAVVIEKCWNFVPITDHFTKNLKLAYLVYGACVAHTSREFSLPIRARFGCYYHFDPELEQDLERGTKYIRETAEARDLLGMGIYSYFKVFGIHMDLNLPLVLRLT